MAAIPKIRQEETSSSSMVDERGQEQASSSGLRSKSLNLQNGLVFGDPQAAASVPQLAFEFGEAALSSAIPAGRLIELSLGGMTTAVSFLKQAQEQGEPTAWVQPEKGTLFPPDLAESGIDLSSLIVLHVPGKPRDLIRATELLLRSGAFGLVVLDLTEGLPRGAAARWQGRLSGLTREHRARVCVLSRRDANTLRGQASLGPMMSVRVASHRERVPGGALLHHEMLKDKVGVGQPLPLARTLPLGLEMLDHNHDREVDQPRRESKHESGMHALIEFTPAQEQAEP